MHSPRIPPTGATRDSPFPRSGVDRRRVTIIEPAAPADAEALVVTLADRGPGIHAELVLDDGTDAVAFLPKLDVAWLDLRTGDIVPVRFSA